MTSETTPSAWTTSHSREALKTPIFSVHAHLREHPERGTSAEFWSLSPQDWVNILALTPEKKLVLVRQYRHGTDQLTLEIPGGALDEGEPVLEAARRELREETGYESEHWTELGRIAVNPAFMTNHCTTLLATNARLTSEQDFDEHEELSVELLDVEDFFTAIDAGEIDHGIVVSAAYYLKRYLEHSHRG